MIVAVLLEAWAAQANVSQGGEMELTYKDRKIRTTSYQMRYGLWMPRAEVVTGGSEPTVQSLPGDQPLPSQEEADRAALEVAKAWIDKV